MLILQYLALVIPPTKLSHLLFFVNGEANLINYVNNLINAAHVS